MARKKKEQPSDPGRPEGYEVLIGFVKKFTFVDHTPEEMNGHPTEGRCYRLIRDNQGYRLHIGRENNDAGLDGLYLGDKLKAKRRTFSYDIEIVTPQNFLELGIHNDDLTKVVDWQTTDNADMWERLKKEAEGTVDVVRQLSDLLKLDKEETPVETSITFHAPDIDIAKRLSNSLNTISDKEPEAFFAILDVIEYIASTYSDKYNSPSMPNLTKSLLVSSDVGAPMNAHAIMKYAQRYITTGYEKSYNVKDMFKAIHYALFEVQRRRFTNTRGI